ncbi:MAG: hypothetical protein GY696_30490 [Gammaproteobacteria bacterium]|nr:hypothetical protein [Gammaproteobacteria bacterium]
MTRMGDAQPPQLPPPRLPVPPVRTYKEHPGDPTSADFREWLEKFRIYLQDHGGEPGTRVPAHRFPEERLLPPFGIGSDEDVQVDADS